MNTTTHDLVHDFILQLLLSGNDRSAQHVADVLTGDHSTMHGLTGLSPATIRDIYYKAAENFHSASSVLQAYNKGA